MRTIVCCDGLDGAWPLPFVFRKVLLYTDLWCVLCDTNSLEHSSFLHWAISGAAFLLFVLAYIIAVATCRGSFVILISLEPNLLTSPNLPI